MLDKIIQFSIRNKPIVGLLTLALIIWGVWSATKLPIDAVPDITNNQVQIITVCPTLAGQEVEQLVTYPVEQSIANLPDLVELRSISRFGLSVVTAVFDEDVNIYFARQLISESLKEAETQIPKGVGTPTLAPVSTGLGEVYQYIIHPKPGSEHKYTAADLRTLQDWIVARQLYGTPGIAEVNSFGGLLKQYEVAVNPDRLRAMGVSIPEVFLALEQNNENTGGAYIDQKPNAYFIRGVGLVTSLDDIRNIVVKNNANGIPILIKDVADVRFGAAVRYGALTYNGEVDAVGGVVMMLKGANSAEVVARVKEKMINIRKSLPEDVSIEPFLDRTDLVNRAINTVEKNLIEGALIVIFVLVLFLGNFRAGLIVASAIPLSMLFALGLMNVFGVSANLMSLGAIDFGLIVDGAVIIVEATLHHLGLRKTMNRLTQAEMDDEVFLSASKIRNSAAFGEIIILIVYIPILTLVGVEGKMFRPMAQTVGFAIFGALILSLTYIPMMCALFLPKNPLPKRSFSDRMMEFFHRLYEPLLQKAIRVKYWVVGVSVVLLAAAVFAFSRMGGEFIPTLQEGDYAFHCILPQGTSLSQSIETSMQAMRLIKEFPEVRMVVGKTGSAEIPTDPMPPEATDMIILLHPQNEWTTGRSYDELADAISEKLESIPGVYFEKNQPIQMRFNELMTGIRQDVAVKIFGENMDSLLTYANKVSAVIRTVDGATEPMAERVQGLPQITVKYNRSRIANYGLSIEEINHLLSTAFAGGVAGVVYENERRFDMVVRLDSMHRSNIDDVRNLFIPLPSGMQIPLSQVADINMETGPAQISREGGKRRIVIGFNVKDRDVQSVVEEIQQKLDTQVKLPPGYYYSYGGTFENLQKASARLLLAVPVSLALIFLLLYFTFRSGKQALLIFMAIPMAAIGGVFALLLRGMPFSISAGVGFIALFGVAVLNGIVLIGTFNQLEKEGWTDPVRRIAEGTRIRLRPVLMTALVASLGFLPMALSHSAGAEVQKPLATVVIGGLLTATFLTLFVLPLLYLLFSSFPKRKITPGIAGLVLIGLLTAGSATAQLPAQRISLDTALARGLANNLQLEVNDLAISKAGYAARAGVNAPKTGLFVENEDANAKDARGILKIGVVQNFEFPTVYAARKKLFGEEKGYAVINKSKTEAELKMQIRSSYYELWFWQSKRQLVLRLDSLYRQLYEAAVLRQKTGESPGLERIAAEAKMKELQTQLLQARMSISLQQQELMKLLNSGDSLLAIDDALRKIDPIRTVDGTADHPLLQLQKQNIRIAGAEIRYQKQTLLPDFSTRFFHQALYGNPDRFYGYSVTMGIPLFAGSFASRIKAAKVGLQLQEKELEWQTQQLGTQAQQLRTETEQNEASLRYYESTGLQQADEIIRAAELSYRSGEISFAELSQYLTQAIDIRNNYLDRLNLYNQSVIRLSYLLNR